jgi:hypothetical protein
METRMPSAPEAIPQRPGAIPESEEPDVVGYHGTPRFGFFAAYWPVFYPVCAAMGGHLHWDGDWRRVCAR